ncbi:UDP-N-acetyl-D-glucosamine 2-epimerase, UDP-hydrolysing [bacterium CG10_46_32]|nr:MAG: UDP-N-acetyl-D-glucosamine 2-epimerase, UDP-hydrolysing [bacterium CG10_46_32]PIR56353.1 MAG: UDP-N-acetylglucosamine 2-epimerase (hydrolyzing) [Parcubacteria group bacterium CG10_big_fil_rev_8_21_14_0_10_46_32]
MSNKKRTVLFISERRADYSRLKPIMKAVQKSTKLNLKLVVTGTHLLKNFGETKRVVEKDGFWIDAKVPMFKPRGADDGAAMVEAMARVLGGLPKVYKKLKPDIVFCGFDLGAHLAAAITAMHMNIHVAHIQGGERSGTIDEVLRHACTKFSHIHFVATEKSRKRVIKLGEDSKYVYNVGSPSLDTIKSISYPSKKIIFKKYHLDPEKKLIIFLQHPVTTEVDEVVVQIHQTIDAVHTVNRKYGTQALAIYSNNDAGGKRIVAYLKKSGIAVLPHVVYEDFLRLLKHASVLVGNSSTGIHEAPSFGLPTVNVGTRQQFRERGKNVIDTPNNKGKILQAIEKSLFDKKYIKMVESGSNPYDNGDTAKQVVHILESETLPSIQKVITY